MVSNKSEVLTTTVSSNIKTRLYIYIYIYTLRNYIRPRNKAHYIFII